MRLLEDFLAFMLGCVPLLQLWDGMEEGRQKERALFSPPLPSFGCIPFPPSSLAPRTRDKDPSIKVAFDAKNSD
ncbi:uncharacterized protein LY79DRAFT_563566 [Colletotrichum navitas]|uniref:Uncharacterized protein n=1 Tax=Colletotrichum navitas TaxID=681940 RepID=A0AAD8PS82_9PEZI|nr:uncharacterized protein LY79DRAFT_563566 [Colletotrichum navitas]KAK1579671.1 hypothetical protein LY79DRAFT_563566 [Colletotrichum navitas]